MKLLSPRLKCIVTVAIAVRTLDLEVMAHYIEALITKLPLHHYNFLVEGLRDLQIESE